MKNSLHTKFSQAFVATIFGTVIAAVALPVTAAGIETTAPANAENADYVTGKKFVEAKDWKNAVAAFERATAAEPKNADAWNMLGYTRRWAGNIQGAFAAYDRALKIDPNHVGALHYSGVAHLRNRDLSNAQAKLSRLDTLCSKRCDEYKALAEAITEYQRSGGDTASAGNRSKY
jgi:Flp pilus assembly protein TadD